MTDKPPRTMWQRIKITALAVALLLLAVFAACLVWLRIESGPAYSIEDHDPVLERHAADARPVIAALAEYHSKNGAYPKTAEEVFPFFVPSQMQGDDAKYFRWRREYLSDGRTYSLAYRLSHDEGLIYEFDGTQGKWVYEPGDGTPRRKVLQLGP